MTAQPLYLTMHVFVERHSFSTHFHSKIRFNKVVLLLIWLALQGFKLWPEEALPENLFSGRLETKYSDLRAAVARNQFFLQFIEEAARGLLTKFLGYCLGSQM